MTPSASGLEVSVPPPPPLHHPPPHHPVCRIVPRSPRSLCSDYRAVKPPPGTLGRRGGGKGESEKRGGGFLIAEEFFFLFFFFFFSPLSFKFDALRIRCGWKSPYKLQRFLSQLRGLWGRGGGGKKNGGGGGKQRGKKSKDVFISRDSEEPAALLPQELRK